MLPQIALVSVGIVSCIGFLLCFIDKSASRTPNARRIPEHWFYLTALFGGTPGVLFGMHLFRHKTKKISFQVVIIVILTLQAGLFYFFFGNTLFM